MWRKRILGGLEKCRFRARLVQRSCPPRWFRPICRKSRAAPIHCAIGTTSPSSAASSSCCAPRCSDICEPEKKESPRRQGAKKKIHHRDTEDTEEDFARIR